MSQVWRDNFKSRCLNVGFRIGLSRAMCEYLSAVADGVQWNRAALGAASADVDNFIATSRSLVLRGLIELKPKSVMDAELDATRNGLFYSWNSYRLTPAGEHVVELLKLGGLFMESDVAVAKKSRAGVR